MSSPTFIIGHLAALPARPIDLPALAVFTVSFLARAAVHSIRRCGQDLCRDDEICCAQGSNSTAVTCCKQLVDKTYYNIAMVTRKLSGMLIMLLLFALGYLVQRVLCSKSGRLGPPRSAHPPVTASREPLVESGAPEPVPGAQLPSYDESKRLPTYEETMRDTSRAAGVDLMLTLSLLLFRVQLAQPTVFSKAPCTFF
uniref:Uncharacterized protein n=1 Tax=Mola mola TaxID=94237 RepID=A0A3Q3XFT1_MOLML